MTESKYAERVRKMLEDGYTIEQAVACIYDLFQNYLIDEPEEIRLYDIADPKEEHNRCFDYWQAMDYENPLIQEE